MPYKHFYSEAQGEIGEARKEIRGRTRGRQRLAGRKSVSDRQKAQQFAAALTRTLLVTDKYALDLSEAQSTDGAAHTFDWVVHGFGTARTDLQLLSWSGFGQANGYQHLTGNRAAATG